MDRKWRTNRSALDTVLSFPQFTQLAQPWRHGYTLATLTDLYAVYTVLHIESKEWSLQWSEEGQFYYFLVKQTIVDGTVAAPEGDEDPPEVSRYRRLQNSKAFFVMLLYTPLFGIKIF